MKVKFNEAGPRPPTGFFKVESFLSLGCFSLSWLRAYPDSHLLDPRVCLSQMSNAAKKNLFLSGPSQISKTEADIPSLEGISVGGRDKMHWLGGSPGRVDQSHSNI